MNNITSMKLIRRKIFYTLVSKKNSYLLKTAGKIPSASWTYAPELIVSPAIVISGGVGDDISFELDLAASYDCQIYLFDPSETGINTIKSLNMPDNIKFNPIGISGETKEYSIATNSKPSYIRYNDRKFCSPNPITLECTSIKDIVINECLPKIDLLKIDIEGFEYETLDSMLSACFYPKQICVEFHHKPLIDVSKFSKIRMIAKLYYYGYRVIHIKGNDHTFLRVHN